MMVKFDRIGPAGEGIQVWFQTGDDESEDIFQFFDPADVKFVLGLTTSAPEFVLVSVRDRMGLTVH